MRTKSVTGTTSVDHRRRDAFDRLLCAFLAGVEDADPAALDIPIVTELCLLKRTEMGVGAVVMLVARTVAGADVCPVVTLKTIDVGLLAVGEQDRPLVLGTPLNERAVGIRPRPVR